jgi:hypothetical protein
MLTIRKIRNLPEKKLNQKNKIFRLCVSKNTFLPAISHRLNAELKQAIEHSLFTRLFC